MDTPPLTVATARTARRRAFRTPRGRTLAIFSSVVVAVFAVLPFVGSLNLISVLTQALIYGALAVTLDVVWGYGGILDLGHGIWFGLGALGVGIASTAVSSSGQVLSVNGDLGSHLIGLVLGMAAAAVLAIAVSLVAFSGRGQTVFYIGVLTLALSVIAGTMLLQFESVTGGEAGLYGFGLAALGPVTGYWLSLAVLVIFAGLAFVVVRSDFGVLLRAVRDQETRVSFFGFRVWQVKTLTFVSGAVFAAMAGALYGSVIGLVSPPLFDFLMATNIVIWVAIGGRATIFGPIIGAIVITAATNQLNTASPELWELIVGVIFVVVIVFMPRGLIAPLARVLDRVPGMRPRASSGSERVLRPTKPEPRFEDGGRPLVIFRGFSFGYGGREVLTALDLDVQGGELLAIVGPNGAGKSTLLTALSDGRLRYGGEVTFTYTSVKHAGMPPHSLLKAGLARKFQTPDLFPTLTVAETIMLAARRGAFPSPWRRSRTIDVPSAVIDVVSAMGLSDHLDTPSGLLAHGLRQGLEMAAMIATNPRMLLLDEPTAGLTSAERQLVGDILTSLVRDRGVSVVLIEHDLDFVKQIADRVAVLARGSVLQVGTPTEVAESALVREIYTGEAGL